MTRQLQRLVRADGLFWMSWADFSAIFTSTLVPHHPLHLLAPSPSFLPIDSFFPYLQIPSLRLSSTSPPPSDDMEILTTAERFPSQASTHIQPTNPPPHHPSTPPLLHTTNPPHHQPSIRPTMHTITPSYAAHPSCQPPSLHRTTPPPHPPLHPTIPSLPLPSPADVEICRKSMPFKRASFEDLGTDFSSRHKPQESRRLQCGQVVPRALYIEVD